MIGAAATLVGVLAAEPGATPRPQAFGPPPVPVPSSFWLVLAGLIGVIGWNVAWNRWRSRSRGQS
jgi:hypothetical protein